MNFSERVHRVVRGIPKGRVMSYSRVARDAGSPGAARAVGNLMRRNHCPGVGPGRTPCHRVVKADGSLGGFSGSGGPEGKRKLLEREGVSFDGEIVKKRLLI
jgi:O-6-methylguanine DNA methyltransferase